MTADTKDKLNHNSNPDPIEKLDHVMHARREKLMQLIELGINPYPYRYYKTHTIESTLSEFDRITEAEENISLAGRLMSLRLMGKAAFADIQEEEHRIQVYFKKNIIGDEQWELFRLLDIGDIVGVTGELFTTRTGERTLKVKELTLLAKNLRPLPAVKEKEDEVWFRWDDKEDRYRNRTLDLILNNDSRKILLQRSSIVREIRSFMDKNGFLEVETPSMQPLYGGAAARPFVTHYNALDQDFYLRIADELYLKRLITGDLPRVYEIAKDYRNEGIDRLHSPEFTMLECYCAYEDYNYCADLIERLISQLAERVLGFHKIDFDNHEIDLTPPYSRTAMVDLILEKCGVEIVGRNRDELANEMKACGIEIEKAWGIGKLIDELFSKKVEPELIQPTFVFDYPIELSPLAKKHRSKPGLVERFELFIGGLEVCNAFSELNNPIDQRQRFEEQARLLAEGDEEAHPIDYDFLQTLEIGMPPTAGLGVGIDRLVMLLTGASSLRDVILFPTLRHKN